MGDDQGGYDDQFNDGLFGTTLHNSRRTRPVMWPRSVSEMRAHTSYGGQNMAPGGYDEDWHSNYMLQRQGARAPSELGAGTAFWRDTPSRDTPPRPGAYGYGGHWYRNPAGGPPVWFASGRVH